jgi:hypothetical protein
MNDHGPSAGFCWIIIEKQMKGFPVTVFRADVKSDSGRLPN